MKTTKEFTFNQASAWKPACGGTELPFTVGDYTYIYLHNSVARASEYYCIDTDLFITDEEMVFLQQCPNADNPYKGNR